jgi:hypothetical protein
MEPNYAKFAAVVFLYTAFSWKRDSWSISSRLAPGTADSQRGTALDSAQLRGGSWH